MIQWALRGGRSDMSKMLKIEISQVMHAWGHFGVIGGPRAHIEASTELGAKLLLIPTLSF